MDRVMAALDPAAADSAEQVHGELAMLIPHCRWTAGRWEALDLRWNEIQNVPRHTHELSSFLIRAYLQARAAQR
jgi:hypothetical protein